MNSPNIVTINRQRNRPPLNRQRNSFRELSREYRNERIWSFVVELVLFAVLAVISAWPIIDAVEALRSL